YRKKTHHDGRFGDLHVNPIRSQGQANQKKRYPGGTVVPIRNCSSHRAGEERAFSSCGVSSRSGCTIITSTAIGKSILRYKGSGNREEKSTPAPRSALDPDAAPVSLDDGFGDGEPEPGAAPPSLGRLPKSVKDTGQVLRGDASARIRNPEND